MKRSHKQDDSDSEGSVQYQQNNKKRSAVQDSDSDEPQQRDRSNSGSDAGSNEEAPKLEIFIKSLSFDVQEDDLAKIFGKYGAMSKCKLIQQNGRSRGIAFVEYEKAADAKKAKESEDGQNHMGRDITVDFSGNKPSAPAGGDRGGEESNTLFVGNISFNTTEDSVRDFFQKYSVSSVRIAMGDDGRARGFCHVEFDSHQTAKDALNQNGQDLDGRQVRLDLSGGRKPGFGGGRGRGGFGDRGGRGGFRGGDRGGFRGGDRGGFRGGDRGGFRGGDRGGFRGGDRGRGGFRGGDRGGFRGSRY